VASKRRTRTSVETHNHGAISPAGVARVVSGTYSDATDLGWTAADRPPAETESITNFGAGNIEVDNQSYLSVVAARAAKRAWSRGCGGVWVGPAHSKTVTSTGYSSHYRPRFGNLICDHPISAIKHRSSYQFLAAPWNRIV